MIEQEELEEVEELLKELKEYSSMGVPIIVEGPRDEMALRELSVTGKIFHISGNHRTALNFLESLVGYGQVIILTDFDERGDELAEFCAKQLLRLEVEPIVHLREKLRALLRKNIKGIEDTAKFLKSHSLKIQ
ncbi:MAG: hypothetical protein APU95_05880 [Hadesarchaea archaeon YNP_N21]|nr:MAG: hypothetical protein APU95_05880 [Hadesarchaea archaeon YNP_N21]